MRSQINMMWNNVPHCIPSSPSPRSWSLWIACHEYVYLFIYKFVNKKVFTICHDVHVCNYICMKYVNAHIHHKLNPRPHGSTPRP